MSSRARLFRWIVAAAVVLIAVVVGIVTYQIFRDQQIAEERRLGAQQAAEDQRQRAEQTLTAAAGNANGLTVDLSRLFESEVTAPPARVKEILDRARALQQQTAEDQRANAQQALLAATGTANDLTFDLANLFENEITAPPARVKDILDRTRVLQQQLTASGGLTPELSRGEAAALRSTVDLLLKINDTAGALSSADRARQVLEGLLATDSSNTGWQRDLALSHEKIGNTLVSSGKREEAAVAFQTGLAIRQKLADADPGDADWQGQLGLNYDRLGDVLLTTGKFNEAREAYEKGLAVRKNLVDGDPGNARWQRDVSVSYERVGNALSAAGRREEAIAAYQKGLEISQKLADGKPDNAEWQRDLAFSYDKVGDVLAAAGRREQALAAYQKGLAISQKLADGDPGNAEAQRGLALSFDNVGDALAAAGKGEEAVAAFRKGLAIRQKIADSDPRNGQPQRELTVSYNKLGDTLEAAGKRDDALAAYQKGLAIRQKLADSNPGDAERQRDLAISHDRIGVVLAAAGKRNEALAAYRKDLAIRQKLAESNPRNTDWQSDLQFSIARIGGFSYRFILAKEYAKALEVADQAIALAPRTTWFYTNRAHALMFLGRVDQARALYLQYRGEKKAQDDKSWVALVVEDFAELRKAKLTHPLMDEIEKRFAAGG